MVTFSVENGECHLALLEKAFVAGGRPVPACLDALSAYLDELALWSSRSSITGFGNASERVNLGVMDCVFVADMVADGAGMVDVGSGNGLPGIVVAIMRPDLTVTLVEPSARRAAFLRIAASRAGASNLEVQRCRVQEMSGTAAFDVAVSRAVFPPDRWLATGLGLVRTGGSVLCMTAGTMAPSPPRGLHLVQTVRYDLEGGIVSHLLVRYERRSMSREDGPGPSG